MEQLQREMLKKDQKIEEYKKLVDHLQTHVEKFQATMDELSNRLLECERIANSGKEEKMTKSTRKTCTYEWVTPFQLLEHGEQRSDFFYPASKTFCFQLSACLENNKLTIYLHRCRGVNDIEIGRIRSCLSGFMFTIYVINRNGKLKMKESDCNYKNLDFNVGANYQRSRGNGWTDFLDGENMLDWLIKSRLHIFCRIDPERE